MSFAMMPCGTNNKLKLINSNSAKVGGEVIMFSPKVKNLGVTIGNELSMNATVSNIRKSSYFELRKIAQLRPFRN